MDVTDITMTNDEWIDMLESYVLNLVYISREEKAELIAKLETKKGTHFFL